MDITWTEVIIVLKCFPYSNMLSWASWPFETVCMVVCMILCTYSTIVNYTYGPFSMGSRFINLKCFPLKSQVRYWYDMHSLWSPRHHSSMEWIFIKDLFRCNYMFMTTKSSTYLFLMGSICLYKGRNSWASWVCLNCVTFLEWQHMYPANIQHLDNVIAEYIQLCTMVEFCVSLD